MDFRLLGALEVVGEDGREVAIGSGRQRALLALLLLRANEPVSSEVLVEQLWGEAPPPTAVEMLRNQVAALRRVLGGERLETRGGGYRLKVSEGERDVDRFEALVAAGRECLDSDPEAAAEAFGAALSLWRGPALADLAYESFAQAEVGRLEERRLVAFEGRVEAGLALGRHADLVAELEVAVKQEPLRERLQGQLMLALYRCGRQAEALAAYRGARELLVEQLGLEPSHELRELHQAILTHDPQLEAPERPTSRESRLPTPPTRTIGRDDDQEAVADLLRLHDVRLVTLTGPGGVGKTRLALEVTRRLEPEFADGAWFVSLGATANPDHVPSTVAQGLDVVPLQGETPKQAVERFLAPRHGLIAVDNFEHLLAAAPLMSELLAACPRLTVLTTSREALRLEAEHRYEVAPLRIPEDGEPAVLQSAAAAALFVERTLSRDRDFELTSGNALAIADVCRRLDGLPLAIELAAARTTLLGVEELSRRLAQALDVLGSGPRDAPARQRTLRATIEWSHRLLSAPEGEAFARFAVFAGGATLKAAEDVTGADLDVLEGLVEKNLVMRRSWRLMMLETVREYACERLEASPDSPDVRLRHARHYLDLAERAAPAMDTHAEAVWLPRLDAEIENIRAALDWSIRQGDAGLALRLAGFLREFWESRGWREGLEHLAAAVAAAGVQAPVQDRARALRAQVNLLASEGSVYDAHGLREQAKAMAADALALSREAGDVAGVAEALIELGYFDTTESLPQKRRRRLAEEALAAAREAQDEKLAAHALMERACAALPSQGMAEIAEAEAALRKVGSSHRLVGLYNNAAYNAIKEGVPELARPLLERAAPILRELGNPVWDLIIQHGNVGLEALFNGDIDRAEGAFADQLRLCREHMVDHLASEGLGGMAAIAAHRGRPDRAAFVLGAAGAIGPVGDGDVTGHLERRFLAAARGLTSKEDWRAAEAAGAAAGVEEAIEVVLDTAVHGAAQPQL